MMMKVKVICDDYDGDDMMMKSEHANGKL